MCMTTAISCPVPRATTPQSCQTTGVGSPRSPRRVRSPVPAPPAGLPPPCRAGLAIFSDSEFVCGAPFAVGRGVAWRDLARLVARTVAERQLDEGQLLRDD